MLFRTEPTALLQIFSESIVNSEVIIKSDIDPDFLEKLLSINSKNISLGELWVRFLAALP